MFVVSDDCSLFLESKQTDVSERTAYKKQTSRFVVNLTDMPLRHLMQPVLFSMQLYIEYECVSYLMHTIYSRIYTA